MTLLMGQSPEDKSYLIAVGFNWYPTMILPVVLSLLVGNSCAKEKAPNQIFYLTLGCKPRLQLIAKNIVVLFELFVILITSSFLLFLLGYFLIKETVVVGEVIRATWILFIGSLPIVGISFVMNQFLPRAVIILVNFICTLFIATTFALKMTWWLFPWSYTLRMLCPVLGIHPNGTFLSDNDTLRDPKVIWMGILLSVLTYLLALFFQLLLNRRRKNA
jgi:ABC-2 type transport system permease protein